MQRVDKFRILWLALGIAAAVCVCLFSSLIIIMGLRSLYVPVGIFAGLTLVMIYAVPFCFIAYHRHRIYTKIAYAVAEGKNTPAAVANAAEIKAEYISTYITRCKRLKYINENDIKEGGESTDESA